MLLNAFMILSLLASGTPAAELYEVEFSTYIGGSGFEHIRDICADKQGNVYITGGTTSSDYPTTQGAYQRTHGGMFDIFVTKFSPNGEIIWSTLVGGKDYDRAYAIEVDNQGYVYVGGRGGRYAPITPGVAVAMITSAPVQLDPMAVLSSLGQPTHRIGLSRMQYNQLLAVVVVT